jgi:hypothetical protein
MIEKQQNSQPASTNPKPDVAPKRPNETGSISVEGHVKIFDPKSKEVYVEKRA